MKNVLLLFFLFLPFIGEANPVKDIALLEKNDWIQFEITGYYPGAIECAPWMVENVRKVVFKATVLDRKKDRLILGFTVDRITDQVTDPQKQGFYYYDSWYEKNYSSEKNLFDELYPSRKNVNIITQIPEKDFIHLTLNLQGGELEVYSVNIAKELLFVYPSRFISDGIYPKDGELKNIQQFKEYKITEEPIAALRNYIAEWIKCNNERRILPYSMSLSGTSLPSEIRVVNASFPLPSNVKLIYNRVDKQSKKRLTETHNFFTSIPLRYVFAEKQWLVLPGDSLVLNEDESGNYSYSGAGADKNNLQRELIQKASLQTNYSFIEGTAPEVINSYLSKWDSAYVAVYTKYDTILDPFWKKSFELTRSYYQSYIRVFACSVQLVNDRDTKGLTDWSSVIFSTLSPFTDYQYLPMNYTLFLNAFVGYKITQFTNDNLTNIKNFWGNYLDQYYLQNQILSGYPRYAVNAEVLDALMRELPLSGVQREYEEFVSQCPDTVLVNNVEAVYNSLSKIEPGAFVQKLGLSLAKEFPLKGKGRNSYVLLNISLLPANEGTNLESLNQLREGLNTGKLSEYVSLQLYRPESLGNQLPDSLKSYFRLVSDKVLNECIEKTSGGIAVTLLIRGDGTILYRSLDPFNWYSGKIMEVIKHDMNRKEPATAGSSFLLGVFVMFCLAGFIGIILYVRFKIRQKREHARKLLAELELKALRSQMNPHFIFNALNSIQNLINRSEVELANRYLLNFAKLLRIVLSSSEKKLITLSEEMDMLRLYLSLEQLRMPFLFSIEKEDSIEPEIIEIPGMLIQPLVENAVKHAIVPNRGGHITIRFSMKNSILIIEIEDDGPGINVQESTNTNGFGLKIVKERLKLLQEQLQTRLSFSISITNRKEKNTSGCIITLIIPIE